MDNNETYFKILLDKIEELSARNRELELALKQQNLASKPSFLHKIELKK